MDGIPPASDDDQVCLMAACGGDLAAFSRLVLKHQWAVRAFLLARLSRKHEAEDLAQETFLTAWRRLKDFDMTRPIGPWLRGIAENHLRNHLRKFRAEPIGGSEALQQILDFQAESYQGLDTESELALALADCIEKVDASARELLIARYAEGRSLAEICKRTGKKHSAMTMKLHRLRLALASCVEGRISQTI